MTNGLEREQNEQERRIRNEERKARMRKEKELQARRRRLMRLSLRIAAKLGIIAAVLLAGGLLLWRGGRIVWGTGTEPVREAAGVGNAQSQDQGEEVLGQERAEEDLSGENSPVLEELPRKTLMENICAVSRRVREEHSYAFTESEKTLSIHNAAIVSSHIILVDEQQNEIIAKKGEQERISPASMTKVLTLLVAAEMLTEADLEDTFEITREITDYGYVNECSMAGFLVGEKVTVRDLLYGTILPSGADAAVALAVYTAGSHEAFVELMNQKLERLGLGESAHFTNSVGLYDQEHYCTVYDMAIMMKAAMNNKICREVLSARTYVTSATEEHPEGIELSNWFLRRIEDKETGGEVVGAKTGFVVQSQNCAVSFGTFPQGKTYICVTAGSTNSWQCIYDHVEIYQNYISGQEGDQHTVSLV